MQANMVEAELVPTLGRPSSQWNQRAALSSQTQAQAQAELTSLRRERAALSTNLAAERAVVQQQRACTRL